MMSMRDIRVSSRNASQALHAFNYAGAEDDNLAGGGKSFKELHAERNKQAQRRFRKRQKVGTEKHFLAAWHFLLLTT